MKRSLMLASAVVLSITAAACGSDEDSGSEPAATAAPAAETNAPAAEPAAAADIVATATAAGTFNTLASALTAAGLVETLQGPGPFTVFAPTDEAFAKLPPETLADLLKPENKDQLAAILTYHVVAGEVKAEAVTQLTSATTVNGKDIAIKVDGANVTLNGETKVLQTDIGASNGVIHVIDSVLLP